MDPRPETLLVFTDCLLDDAPPTYVPWLFRCGRHSKAPATEYGSWKDTKNRLTVDQAVEWMLEGGNVGIAGMPDDPLVNVDIDDGEVTRKEDLAPTLMSRSRSRTGIHGFYFSWDNIPNIPTDNAGEVRSRGQYVVAPGSYVATDPETVPENQRRDAGYYTVEEARPPAWITYQDLPEIFRKTYEKNRTEEPRQPTRFDPKKAGGSYSALFDVKAIDIIRHEGKPAEPNRRWGSLFHDSTTEANMSLSTKGLLHCWRHNVTHNGLQALTVLSGYMTCQEAGTPHRGTAGSSRVVGDDGAVFHAWLYAKKHGYIPGDDPIPVRALNHIAQKHLGYEAKKNKLLPSDVYRRVLEIVEADY
ncbi:MAG: bifunctional DNA primase/polymerase [Candidatus Bathyarchaeota archaeon]